MTNDHHVYVYSFQYSSKAVNAMLWLRSLTGTVSRDFLFNPHFFYILYSIWPRMNRLKQFRELFIVMKIFDAKVKRTRWRCSRWSTRTSWQLTTRTRCWHSQWVHAHRVSVVVDSMLTPSTHIVNNFSQWLCLLKCTTHILWISSGKLWKFWTVL